MNIRRELPAIAALLVVGALISGCGHAEPQQAPVTVTVTSAPEAAGPDASGEPTKPQVVDAELVESLQAVAEVADQPVGLSVAPLGAAPDDAIGVGDQTPRVAWSTIKVPLAVAAQRAHGASSVPDAAIISSDNSSAEMMWSALGAGDTASAAVEAVLREGSDPDTDVPSQQLRAGYTVFGQTVWGLSSAAVFTANLPCLDDAERVVDLMGQVAGNQQWGVEIMPSPTATAVKGGWGPGAQSGYLVRQIAIITHSDGTGTAVALSTVGTSLNSGIAALNAVANGLDPLVDELPAGRC